MVTGVAIRLEVEKACDSRDTASDMKNAGAAHICPHPIENVQITDNKSYTVPAWLCRYSVVNVALKQLFYLRKKV